MIRLLLCAALVFAVPALAANQPYLTPGQVDLVRLLPPPPADDPAKKVMSGLAPRVLAGVN